MKVAKPNQYQVVIANRATYQGDDKPMGKSPDRERFIFLDGKWYQLDHVKTQPAFPHESLVDVTYLTNGISKSSTCASNEELAT